MVIHKGGVLQTQYPHCLPQYRILLADSNEALDPFAVYPVADCSGGEVVVGLYRILDVDLTVLDLIDHDVVSAIGIGRIGVDACRNERVGSKHLINQRKMI